MGLRERKLINNLPHYSGGEEPSGNKTWLQKNLHLPEGGEGWGNAITGSAGLLSAVSNAFSPAKTATSMLSDAGLSTGYGPGFSYVRLNSPNYGKELAELSRLNTLNTLNTAAAGASAGAAFGPIGAGAGFLVGGLAGLLGGGARKREFMDQMKIAKTNTLNFNLYSFASGQSDFLANDFNVNHNVQLNDLIYHAKDGKLPLYSIGKADAMLSNGEVAGHVNPKTGEILDAYKVGKGVDFKDDIPVKLGKDTKTKSSFVLTRKEDPNIGVSPAELALSGDIYGALDLLKYMKNYLAYKQFKNGKLPMFATGLNPIYNITELDVANAAKAYNQELVDNSFIKPENLMPKARDWDDYKRQVGGTTEGTINDYIRDNDNYNVNVGSKRSSWIIPAALSGLGVAIANSMRPTGEGTAQPTFVDNNRAQQAIALATSRRVNINAQQSALRDAEARARHDSRTRGTSIGTYIPESIARYTLLLKQIAQVNAFGQDAYNKLAGENAQMMANIGEHRASRMQQSNQNWREMLHRAKSLDYTLDNNAKAQELGQIQHGYKSISDLYRWLDTMGLYNQDYALRRDELLRRTV